MIGFNYPFERTIKRLRVFIDFDLAGHVDEPLDLLWVALGARALRLAWHALKIP